MATPTDGIHQDVPNSTYHSEWDAISKSELSELSRSPAHLVAYRAEERPVTPQRQRIFDIGTATHTAILEPHLFGKTVAVRPPGNANSNAFKETKAAMLAEQPALVLLTEKDYRMVGEMSQAVHAHPTAGPLVLACQSEVSAIWTDAETGIRCRGRADAWVPKVNIIGDLKTTKNAARELFRRDVFNYGYYLQAAYYLRGWAALGHTDVSYVVVAIEKDPPYAVAVYEFDSLWLAAAEEEINALLALYQACLATDCWPAYDDNVISLFAAGWQDEAMEMAVRRIDHITSYVRQEE